MTTVLRAFSAAAVAVVALTLVATAGADKPAMTTFRNLPAVFTDDTSCAFAIQVVGADNVTFKTFFDKSGNPIRIQIHDNFAGADSANGNTVIERDAYDVTYDFASDSETWVGLPARFYLPGGGVILRDAGKIVFDSTTGDILVEHGPHPLADGNTQALCDALSR